MRCLVGSHRAAAVRNALDRKLARAADTQCVLLALKYFPLVAHKVDPILL